MIQPVHVFGFGLFFLLFSLIAFMPDSLSRPIPVRITPITCDLCPWDAVFIIGLTVGWTPSCVGPLSRFILQYLKTIFLSLLHEFPVIEV